jgi:hypothetical protein
MLHKETVTKNTLDLIRKFMRDEQLAQFQLVGGTALALRIGHRLSIDIDLFTDKPFQAWKLLKHLEKKHEVELNQIGDNMILCMINNIKVDMIAHQYPNVRPSQNVNGIRMASMEDIAAMKINAIDNSGSRIKDFYDIYYLLREYKLENILNAYMTKYGNDDENRAKRSLLYHEDIDFTAKIQLLDTKLKWKDVVKSLTAAVQEYDKDKAHKLFVQQLKEAIRPNEHGFSNERTGFGRSENDYDEDLPKRSRGPKR